METNETQGAEALSVEETKQPEVVPAVEEVAAPEPAEQVAAFTPQAPAPKDGEASAQRQTAYSTQTIVKGSEAAAKQSEQSEALSVSPGAYEWLQKNRSASESNGAIPQQAQPIADLKSAILQSLNPKSFFPITHILKRYFGARFATQEATKEARVLLESLHNSRQIIVNNNRHMQLARPFYTSATPMTQYHTLDKTPLEAMLGVGIAS